MRKIYILFTFYFLLLTLYNQSITWQRLYDRTNYDLGNDICAADGDNFYVVGNIQWIPDYISFVMKLNPYGDTIWTRVIFINGNDNSDALAVASSGDGGCVVTGYYGPSSFTVKVDENGNVVWIRLYGSTITQCFDIAKTLDGGYVACGNRVFDGYVFKTDSLGLLQWQRYYPALDLKDFNSIVEAPGGGYVITGVVNDSTNDTMKILLLKIDTVGNVVWDKRYKINNRVAGGRKIVRTSLGYLIGAGGSDGISNNALACFIRTDFNGNLLYAKSFSSTKNEYLLDIKYLSPNKYVLSLERDSVFLPEIYNAVGMLVDSNGNILKKVKFNDHDGGGLRGILPLNGGLVFAGDYEYSSNSRYDFYVVRTDSLLNTPPIGIIKNNENIPLQYKLYPAYPNPFNPITEISYDLPKSAYVSLKVYNVLGELVNTLVNNEYKPEGRYTVKFDGTNFASGIYFYSLETKDFKATKKMVLIK